eukprot:gene7746-9527_t
MSTSPIRTSAIVDHQHERDQYHCQLGTGDIPPKSIVSVHYERYLSNNIIFDSSVQSNTPFTFQLGSNKSKNILGPNVSFVTK